MKPQDTQLELATGDGVWAPAAPFHPGVLQAKSRAQGGGRDALKEQVGSTKPYPYPWMEVTAFTVHWLGLCLPSKLWLRQSCGLSSEHTVKPGAGPGSEGVEALFPGSFYSTMSNKGTSSGQVASSKSLLYMQVQYTPCSTF